MFSIFSLVILIEPFIKIYCYIKDGIEKFEVDFIVYFFLLSTLSYQAYFTFLFALSFDSVKKRYYSYKLIAPVN
jgi:hypothetical protein